MKKNITMKVFGLVMVIGALLVVLGMRLELPVVWTREWIGGGIAMTFAGFVGLMYTDIDETEEED